MAILSLPDLQVAGFVEAWLDGSTVRGEKCKTSRQELRRSFQAHLTDNEGTYAEAVSARTFYNYLERIIGLRPVYTYKKLGYRGVAVKSTTEAERCMQVEELTESEAVKLFNQLIGWLEPCESEELIPARSLRHRFMVQHGIDKLTPVAFGLAMYEFINEVGGGKVRKTDGTYYTGVCRSPSAPGPSMSGR